MLAPVAVNWTCYRVQGFSMARDGDLDAARFLSIASMRVALWKWLSHSCKYCSTYHVHSLFIRVMLIQHMFFWTEQLTCTSQNMVSPSGARASIWTEVSGTAYSRALIRSKAIPVTGRCEMLRIPHCLDNGLTVNREILATCSSTYSSVRTSQEAHSVSIM
jgi:hypothetical protein